MAKQKDDGLVGITITRDCAVPGEAFKKDQVARVHPRLAERLIKMGNARAADATPPAPSASKK